MQPTGPAKVSLLYPARHTPRASRAGTPSEADLGLASIVRALDFDGQHSRFIGSLLAALETDPHTISYRQDILEDLLQLPELVAALTAALPNLRALAEAGPGKRWRDTTPLLEVASRLADLDNYVSCVEGLWAALENAELRAQGLLDLRSAIESTRGDPEYTQLVAELPSLRGQLNQASSITIGINLDAQLQPESATILSINGARFSGKSNLLERLLGERNTADTVRGITALYKATESGPPTPEHEFFRDMSRLLERVAMPVASTIDRYARLNGDELAALEPELVFYLGAVRLATELAASSLSLCRPSIAGADAGVSAIEGLYNLDLAIRTRSSRSQPAAIVPNDLCLGEDVSVIILTGPNSGGKTTFTRAVGQAQVLFQAGLLVPGTRARMSPVEGIFTHFATAERSELNRGRLAEELERMSEIFRAASRNSLILCNEPFSSTDHRSARLLALDVIAGLRLLGARTLYVTHLVEIVDDLLPQPDQVSHRGVMSMIAVAEDTGAELNGTPTYRVESGRPRPSGYARELARHYGLQLEQLEQTLRRRETADHTPREQTHEIEKIDRNSS